MEGGRESKVKWREGGRESKVKWREGGREEGRDGLRKGVKERFSCGREIRGSNHFY